jgi:hypothetical protein
MADLAMADLVTADLVMADLAMADLVMVEPETARLDKAGRTRMTPTADDAEIVGSCRRAPTA